MYSSTGGFFGGGRFKMLGPPTFEREKSSEERQWKMAVEGQGKKGSGKWL